MKLRPLIVTVAVIVATLVLARGLLFGRDRVDAKGQQGSWANGKWRTPAATAGKYWTMSGRVVDPDGKPAANVELRGAQPPADLPCSKQSWPGSLDCLCNSTVKEFLDARVKTPTESVYGVTAADGTFTVQVPRDEPLLHLVSPLGTGQLNSRSASGLEVELSPLVRQEFTATYRGMSMTGTVAGSIDLLSGVRIAQRTDTGYLLSPPGWPFAFNPSFQLAVGGIQSPLGKAPGVELKSEERLSGVVMSAKDQPVPGAELTLSGERCAQRASANASGEFSFKDEGPLSFKTVVAIDGDQAAFGELSAGTTAKLELEPNAGPLSFEVTTPDGPLQFRPVSFEVTNAHQSKRRFTERTDAHGRVTFAALPSGSGTLSVWGYEVPAAQRVVKLYEQPPTRHFEVQLTEARPLYLKVVDSRGIQRRKVRIDSIAGAASTDASGWAQLRGLPSEGGAVTIHDDAGGSVTAHVDSSGEQVVTLVLSNAVDVSVKRAGQPVAHQVVAGLLLGSPGNRDPNESRTCETGADGRCSLAFSQPGKVRVGLNGVSLGSNDLSPLGNSRDLEVGGGDASVQLTAP